MLTVKGKGHLLFLNEFFFFLNVTNKTIFFLSNLTTIELAFYY